MKIKPGYSRDTIATNAKRLQRNGHSTDQAQHIAEHLATKFRPNPIEIAPRTTGDGPYETGFLLPEPTGIAPGDPRSK